MALTSVVLGMPGCWRRRRTRRCAWTPDGRIVLVNAQAERLFGYPREELAGQPVEILVPDASKPPTRACALGTPRTPGPG